LTPTRIAIATDAWHPQVNGVVTTLERTAAELGALGFEVLVLNPGLFRTVPCPSYPSIRLAIAPRRVVAERLRASAPHAVYIATEGPIGHAVRRYCLKAGLRFTSSYHTQFPEYLRLRWPVPVDWTYAYLRRFHGSARSTPVVHRPHPPLLVAALRGGVRDPDRAGRTIGHVGALRVD
jgi:hypothetical protein